MAFSFAVFQKGLEAALRKRRSVAFLAAGKRRLDAAQCKAQTARERSGESFCPCQKKSHPTDGFSFAVALTELEKNV